MNPTKLAAALALPALLGTGCIHQYAHTREWGEAPYAQPAPTWERTGRVTHVRETTVVQQGDPAGGAVAGAVVGGLLGHAITGGHGGGLVGAVGGAAVGASASQGRGQQVTYEVTVQFDDGGIQAYAFRGYLPFRPGDQVRLTSAGLSRL